MIIYNDIEKDTYYKRLKKCLAYSGLSNVEQIMFLSVFEAWFHFIDRSVYLNLAKAAISTLEGLSDEEL
jgi:hypothetical protein